MFIVMYYKVVQHLFEMDSGLQTGQTAIATSLANARIRLKDIRKHISFAPNSHKDPWWNLVRQWRKSSGCCSPVWNFGSQLHCLERCLSLQFLLSLTLNRCTQLQCELLRCCFWRWSRRIVDKFSTFSTSCRSTISSKVRAKSRLPRSSFHSAS